MSGAARPTKEIAIMRPKAQAPITEEQKMISPEGERLLLRILAREDAVLKNTSPVLLSECLKLLIRGGGIPSAEVISGLLDAGFQRPRLRPDILTLLGKSGLDWARKNPNWAYAAGVAEATDREVWEKGTKATKVEYFRRLRTSNPALAREQLCAQWNQEPAANREIFVKLLATGLSMDDEQFLECVVKERGKYTRRAAAALLARLPESKWSQRVTERMAKWVGIEKNGSGTPRILVTLPDKIEAEDKLDGLEVEQQGADEEERKKNILRAMIELAPLSGWTEQSGLAPEKLIDAALRTAHADTICGGWTGAADNQKNQAWLLALLKHKKIMTLAYSKFCRIEGLDWTSFHTYWKEQLDREDKAIDLETLVIALGGCQHLLDQELTDVLVKKVLQWLPQLTDSTNVKFIFITDLALFGDLPSLIQEDATIQELIHKEPKWIPYLNGFKYLVDFRHAMHKELSQ